MKTILILFVLLLSGCSSLDHWVCYGAGTCGSDGPVTGRLPQTTAHRGAFTPTTVNFGNTNYVIVPNYSTGQISAVIPSGR